MRADLYLYICSHTKSRQNAKILIEKGVVKIDGKLVCKPSYEIDEESSHSVEITERERFVSRGGEKLDGALNAFKIDVKGLYAIDVGASTGGFTDCLLQRGAKEVYAVDSGCGQLDLSLENDKRVVSIEKYNAKFMKESDFPHKFDIAVTDVSFISQTLLHSAINSVLKDESMFVSLIKPQFECGRKALSKGGIVNKKSDRENAIKIVIASALENGFSVIDIVRSSIEGGSGNIEYLACFKKSQNPESFVSANKIKELL